MTSEARHIYFLQSPLAIGVCFKRGLVVHGITALAGDEQEKSEHKAHGGLLLSELVRGQKAQAWDCALLLSSPTKFLEGLQ